MVPSTGACVYCLEAGFSIASGFLLPALQGIQREPVAPVFSRNLCPCGSRHSSSSGSRLKSVTNCLEKKINSD
jgi:hypothetical protein